MSESWTTFYDETPEMNQTSSKSNQMAHIYKRLIRRQLFFSWNCVLLVSICIALPARVILPDTHNIQLYGGLPKIII